MIDRFVDFDVCAASAFSSCRKLAAMLPDLVQAASLVLIIALAPNAAAAQPSFACAAASTMVEQLICAQSGLDAQMAIAFREQQDHTSDRGRRANQLAKQRRWLARRAAACPLRSGNPPESPARNIASECLARIYEHRIAVLEYDRNRELWPQLPFRPALIEGTELKLCAEVERDLMASFLGLGLFVDPLGAREISFVPIPDLGDDIDARRAKFDPYNRGRSFPV